MGIALRMESTHTDGHVTLWVSWCANSKDQGAGYEVNFSKSCGSNSVGVGV